MQHQITEMLAQMGGISSLARELGISESQAASFGFRLPGDHGDRQGCPAPTNPRSRAEG